MPATFISYRRDDAAGYAGRLHEGLERRLGATSIFRDIDTLEPGLDFVDAIGSRLRECHVFLAVIGREWLDAKDAQGRRRLDQPQDFVRLEIAAALARPDVRIIPVLIEGATMPAAESLPEDIRPLARRHAMNLRDDAWDHDVDRLASVIAGVSAGPPAPSGERAAASLPVRKRRLLWLAAGLAVVLPVVLLLFQGKRQGDEVSPAAVSTPSGRYGVAVPPVAEVAHTALIYTLLSANVTPLGNTASELRLRVQFSNNGPYPANAWDASFRLILGAETLAPTGGLNEVVPGHTLINRIVVFTIPAAAREKAVLRVLDGDRVAELPLDLSTTRRPAEDERAEVADSMARAIVRSLLKSPSPLVEGDGLAVTVQQASSRRFANVVRLRFALRLANIGRYPSGTPAVTFRLAAGGQVVAPLQPPHALVDPQATASLDVEFEIPTTATRAVLTGTTSKASGELAVEVPR